MPVPKLIVNNEGLEAQFRLIPKDEEKEEGQLDDDDDDDDDDEDDEDQKNINLDTKKTVEEEQKDNNKNGNQGGDENDPTNGETTKKVKKQPKISLFEMQSFLIALVLPEPRLSTPPNWCKVLRCMRASNVSIFLFDNVDLDWIGDKASQFTHAFRFETTPNWIEQLTSIPLSRRMQNMTIPSEFKTSANGVFESDLNARSKISRTSLLLSPLQMLVENYPMPFEEDISILRSKYYPVTDSSQMFALDCEMCITDKSELTKISIVDEEMRVVYSELVKPELPITNYLTRYSGITQEMMENVTNTLADVHTFLRRTLPRDAILVGHSLNMDLAALNMFHPYVIDTSVIYSRTGVRSYKPSLKALAYELLGKSIQTADQLGHDSLEDAITAMELVKLKLINGLLFGDCVAYEISQGIKFDSRTGITHLQIDKFIERHKVTSITYRCIDTTPGARCLYIHDKEEPLEQEVKDAVLYLLKKPSSICVVLTNQGECYVKI